MKEVEKHQFHQILFGGDQLTAVRARSAQEIRTNSETGLGHLEGLVPVAEDWHAKVRLLGVNQHDTISFITTSINYYCNRSFGKDHIEKHQAWMAGL